MVADQIKNRDLSAWERYKQVWETSSSLKTEEDVEGCFSMHPFLTHTLSLSKSVMGIIDRRTMRYLYLSENASEIFHWSTEHYLNGGVEFAYSNIPLSDQLGLIEFSKIINLYFCRLSFEEKENYRSYLDYRLCKPNGETVRILQQDRVLTYDDIGRINISLFTCSDISNYKNESSQHLRISNGIENRLYEFASDTRTLALLGDLSIRELEVAKLINKGLSRKKVASALGLSFHTVTTHCKNIAEKLNVSDSIEMVNLLKTLGYFN